MQLSILGYQYLLQNQEFYWWKIKWILWLFENHYNIPRGCILVASINRYPQEDIDLLVSYTNEHGPWILRSSAENEDGNIASFAGLYESAILYDLDSFNDKLLYLQQRANSEGLIEYAKNRNISLGKLHFLFQEYIIWEISGVFFSDLFGKWPIIEYVYGTCAGVVNGDINSERIWWNDLDEWGPSHERIILVFQECLKIKESFQEHIDVEWTMKDNLLYFLQVRPIASQ